MESIILEPILKKKKDEEELNKIFENVTVILAKISEFEMLNESIKERMNKPIKSLKKIYQATIDGIDATNFHKKCDGILNTIVFYKTEDERKFGGFTTKDWTVNKRMKKDENSLTFSLDKIKVYKNINKEGGIHCDEFSQSFGKFELSGIYVDD